MMVVMKRIEPIRKQNEMDYKKVAKTSRNFIEFMTRSSYFALIIRLP